MYKFLLSLLLLFLALSCAIEEEPFNSDQEGDEDNPAIEVLIFGHFYGFCQGEQCIETFKLEGNQLFEDHEDDYNHVTFDFVIRDQSDFELVKDIIDLIPQELLTEESQTFGCPDCADQGGIYLKLPSVTTEGSDREFRLDHNQNNIPKYLHSFMDAVTDRISKLQ